MTATGSDFTVVAVQGTAVVVRGTARQGRRGIVHDLCPPRRRGGVASRTAHHRSTA
jgi:hypothetical protein